VRQIRSADPSEDYAVLHRPQKKGQRRLRNAPHSCAKRADPRFPLGTARARCGKQPPWPGEKPPGMAQAVVVADPGAHVIVLVQRHQGSRGALKGRNKSFVLIAVILAQDRQTGRVPRIPANRPRRSAMRRPWPDRGLSSTRYDLRQCSCRPRAMTPAPVALRNFVAELCNFLGGSPRKPVKVRRTQKWNCVRELQAAWNSSSVRADPR
jgi:hypothetical protein